MNRSVWSLSRFDVIVEFELKAFFNSIGSAIGQVFVDPLAYLVFLAAGLQGWGQSVLSNADHRISYLTFVFPGILTIQVLKSFSRMIYRFTVDRRWGLQGMKIVSGVSIFSYVLGMSVIPVAVFLIQVAVAAPVAHFMGAEMFLRGLILASFCGVVAIIFWSCMAMMITMALKNYVQRDLFISIMLLPVMFSAPVLYPLDSAPRYLKIISALNPLTYQVTAIREAFLNATLGQHALILFVATAVVLGIVVYLFGRIELLPSER